MKKNVLALCILLSNFCFSQRTYTEGSFIFEKGEDLAFLTPKTRILIAVNSDSLRVNDMSHDSLIMYLKAKYSGNIYPGRYEKYRTKAFPEVFADFMGKRLEQLNIESGLAIENPDLIMTFIMLDTHVKNINPPGMSSSSHSISRILVTKAKNPKEIVAQIELSGIPGGIINVGENSWEGNIKSSCRRSAEMVGDYFVQNKK